jgi:hypothetical protein
MKLRHPFEWLSASAQKCAFAILLPVTLVVMAILQVLGGPLKTDAAPAGIISFEFAGTLALAQKMVASWGQTGQVYAGLNLGFDFLFIVTYPAAIGLGCVLVARAFSQRVALVASAGVVLAWAQLVAGVLDCVENYALIQILLGAQQEWLPAVAMWCAAPKFAIVGVGIVYVLVGAAVVMSRARGK